MRIDNSWAYNQLEFAAMAKVANDLRKQGFEVEIDKAVISKDSTSKFILDIFAVKGNDRRIYEFKKNTSQITKQRYNRLQEIAKQLSASLYILYVNLPATNKIQFNELSEILFRHFQSKTPQELVGLCLQNVSELNLESISIQGIMINVSGTGVVTYLSDRFSDERFFSFDVTYNVNTKKLEKTRFRFDLFESFNN